MHKDINNQVWIIQKTWAEEPANFLAAPAPDNLSKRLRLLIFFVVFFFRVATAPAPAKNIRLRLLTIGKGRA